MKVVECLETIEPRSRFEMYFSQKRSKTHKQRKEIMENLRESPSTVSEIAERIRLEKPLILWNLMGMLKWGIVSISDVRDNQLVFSITNDHSTEVKMK